MSFVIGLGPEFRPLFLNLPCFIGYLVPQNGTSCCQIVRHFQTVRPVPKYSILSFNIGRRVNVCSRKAICVQICSFEQGVPACIRLLSSQQWYFKGKGFFTSVLDFVCVRLSRALIIIVTCDRGISCNLQITMDAAYYLTSLANTYPGYLQTSKELIRYLLRTDWCNSKSLAVRFLNPNIGYH